MRYYHNIPKGEAYITQRLIYKHLINPSINRYDIIEDMILSIEQNYHLDGLEALFWWNKLGWCQEALRGGNYARLE